MQNNLSTPRARVWLIAGIAVLTALLASPLRADSIAAGPAYEGAMAAYQSGGFPALASHLDELKQVVEQAPASVPTIERHGDNTVIHASDPAESLPLMLIVTAQDQKEGRHGQVVVEPNPYPQSALLLGSYYNEMRRFDEAARWLERGLAMQPDNWMLCLERSATYMATKHPAEAVEILAKALDAAPFLSAENRARLLRNRGVALIDTGRLDDAEKDLNELIRLFPNNPRAHDELTYIARLRAGGAPTETTIAVPPPQEAVSIQGTQPPSKPEK